MKEMLKEIKELDPIYAPSLLKKVYIVEGKYDEKFYSRLMNDSYIYSCSTFASDRGFIECENCMNSNLGCKKHHPKRTIRDNRDTVLALAKKYSNTKSQVFGIIDKDFAQKQQCLSCSNNIYMTKGFALENNLFLSEHKLVDDFLCSILSDDVPDYDAFLQNSQIDKHLPFLNEDLTFDYTKYKKSHKGYDKEYVIDTLIKNFNIKKCPRYILTNWSLKSGEILNLISRELQPKFEKSDCNLVDFIIENTTELFPTESVEDFITQKI